MEVAITSFAVGLLIGWCLAVMMGEIRKSVTTINAQPNIHVQMGPEAFSALVSQVREAIAGDCGHFGCANKGCDELVTLTPNREAE